MLCGISLKKGFLFQTRAWAKGFVPAGIAETESNSFCRRTGSDCSVPPDIIYNNSNSIYLQNYPAA